MGTASISDSVVRDWRRRCFSRTTNYVVECQASSSLWHRRFMFLCFPFCNERLRNQILSSDRIAGSYGDGDCCRGGNEEAVARERNRHDEIDADHQDDGSSSIG